MLGKIISSIIIKFFYKDDAILKEILKDIPHGVFWANFIFQKILKINIDIKWPINFTSRIVGSNGLSIHDDFITIKSFMANGGCYIQALNGIFIGRNFLFATGLKIISANHNKNNLTVWDRCDPIVIGDDVWIGTNVVILPGVKIGNNCIIGAGSIVTKSFIEDNLVIAGNPAHIIKKTV